jgi:hypothetical protein
MDCHVAYAPRNDGERVIIANKIMLYFQCFMVSQSLKVFASFFLEQARKRQGTCPVDTVRFKANTLTFST